MKTRTFSLILFIVFFLITVSCTIQEETQETSDNAFTFAFFTDIHLQPERNAEAGFQQAIDSVNKLNPDFIITGGDLIMDALGTSYGRADSLYDIYTEMIKGFNMPAYHTMGNHEVYGWYERSGADLENPEFGKKMFEKRVGPLYQAVEHKGWKIFILNSVVQNGRGGYMGGIDSLQMAWISEELERTPQDMPLMVSVHIPFITTEAQIFGGSMTPNADYEVITNSKEVLDLFNEHNLKLVLQGHLHFYEYMYAFGTTYITGGAVSGAWWNGPYYGTEEGFLLVHIDGEDFTWEYVDYGWEIGE
jgi:3',5'-cyclic AMP phosphodiesterase CpdA